MAMRKIIRKRVRRNRSGLNLAADIDAVVAINTGQDAGQSRTVVRSSHTVVQGSDDERTEPHEPPCDPKGPPEENT